MFIIDFDDTLFDTHAFKHARQNALAQVGVSFEDYYKSYQVARQEEYYNGSHAMALVGLGYQYESVFNVLEKTTANDSLQQFLFPETLDFLKDLKAYGQPLIILTVGNKNFQFRKIIGSGVVEFFDETDLLPTPKEKTDVLQRLLASHSAGPYWFINDKIDETLKLKQGFSQLRPVLKRPTHRNEQEYASSGFPYFTNLLEIADYVRKNS